MQIDAESHVDLVIVFHFVKSIEFCAKPLK